MSNSDPIVIVGAARTAMGGFQGDFADLTSPELGGAAIKEALNRAGVKGDDVDEVIMGIVLPVEASDKLRRVRPRPMPVFPGIRAARPSIKCVAPA